jgi:zinc protease
MQTNFPLAASLRVSLTFVFIAALLMSRASASVLSGTELRVLPNGLRLIVREQHGAKLIALDAWVRAGSDREGPNESGAAHFLEHLLFKGTPTRKPGEIDAAIEDLGATLSAGTLRYGAHFYTTVASPYAETAIEVVGDALQHASLNAEEMERERTVILDEMARARNDLHKQAVKLLNANAYPDSALGRPVLGTTESLKTISQQTVSGFYHRWYAPNNTTIVIVGDITPEVAEALVKKTFGKWERRKLPDENIPPKEKKVDEALPKEDDSKAAPAIPSGENLAFVLGYPVTSAPDAKDACTADVVAALLADPTSGRIQAALQSDNANDKNAVPRRAIGINIVKVTVSSVLAEGDFERFRGGGLLSIYSQVDRRQFKSVRRIFDDEFRRLQKEAVSADELEYAKRRVVGRYLFEIETYAGQARALGQFDMSGDYTPAQKFDDIVMALKAADITAFAERTLVPARQVEAFLPIQGKK